MLLDPDKRRSNLNTKLLARLVVLVAIISLLGGRSSAFHTRENIWATAYHHRIVTWALEMMGGFSAGLIDDLLDPTEAMDGHLLQEFQDRWPDWAHYKNLPFDFPGIEAAWGYTKGERQTFRSCGAMACGSGLRYFKDHLGVCFHSAADFYAHTNWVKVKSPGDIADLEAEDPWPGLTNQGPGDWPSNPWFVESIYDAVLATIREWHLFEEEVYECFPTDGTWRLNQEGVSSLIKVLRPADAASSLFLNRPAEGRIKGTFHNIEWCSSAIPHTAPLKIELWRDNTWYADIVRADDPQPPHISDTMFSWDTYTCYDALGALKTIAADNAYPHYQIRVLTLDESFADTSSYFYINVPTYGAPSNLAADPYAWGMISLAWQDGSNCESGFEIWRKKDGDADFTFLKAVGANVHSTVDSTILSDTTYHYLVRANFIGQNPSWSNEAECFVPGGAPGEIDQLDGEMDMMEWTPKLTWPDNSNNEEGYVIERRTEWESEFSVVDQNVSPNTTTWHDPDTSNDTVYHYRVKVFNPAGYCYSPEVWVYVGKQPMMRKPKG